MPSWYERQGSRERATLEKIVQRKIKVSPKRLEELQALKKAVELETADPNHRYNIAIVTVLPVSTGNDLDDSTDEPATNGNGTGNGTPPSSPRELPVSVGGESHSSHGKSTGEGAVGEASSSSSSPLSDLDLPSAIEKLGLYDVRQLVVGKKEWKWVKKLLDPKAELRCDVLVLRVSGGEMTQLEKSVVALGFLRAVPVVVLAEGEAEPLVDDWRAYSGRTWPVFCQAEGVVQYCRTDLPSILRLRSAIESDTSALTKRFGEVNVALHGLKRASVALVPFGVALVNLVGVARLCGRMMLVTGMLGDTETQRQVAAAGSITAGTCIIFDQLGDVYQYAIYATILADFATASTLDLAIASLTIGDVFLLGSISLVTGTISAVTAYHIRPILVRTVSRFLSLLQLIYLINPGMRRPNPTAGPQLVRVNAMPQEEGRGSAGPVAAPPARGGGTTAAASAPEETETTALTPADEMLENMVKGLRIDDEEEPSGDGKKVAGS